MGKIVQKQEVHGFRWRRATRRGREHERLNKNNQDGVLAKKVQIGEKTYLVGIVCDGCSGGVTSEVGALLSPVFLYDKIVTMLVLGTEVTQVPSVLFPQYVGFLRGIQGLTISGNMEQLVDFVAQFLLCTVIGFVMDDKEVVFFLPGRGESQVTVDGVIVVNEEVLSPDLENAPGYPGYVLVPPRAFKSPRHRETIPSQFTSIAFPLKDVQRFAITTDGFAQELKKQGDAYLQHLWGYEHNPELQYWVNGESADEKRFTDDVSIVSVERVPIVSPTKGGEGT